MIRPMTSNGSALSSIVANSQSIPFRKSTGSTASQIRICGVI